MESGILYIVYNKWIVDPETKEMPYKIGITKTSIVERYYGLGLKMPGKFETLFAYKIKDYNKAEQAIHNILNKYCVNGEWFKLTLKELDFIKNICETMDGIIVTEEIENDIKYETEEGSIDYPEKYTQDSVNKISIKLNDEDLTKITIQKRSREEDGVMKTNKPLLELFNDEHIKNIELTPLKEFYTSDTGISVKDLLPFGGYIHYSRNEKKWWIIKKKREPRVYIDFYLNGKILENY